MRVPLAFTFKIACHILRQKPRANQRFASVFQPELSSAFCLLYVGRATLVRRVTGFEVLSYYPVRKGLFTGDKRIQVNGRTG